MPPSPPDLSPRTPVALIVNCACGSRAVRAVAAVFQVGDKTHVASVPMCETCLPQVQLLRIEAQSISTHEPFGMRKAASFPPSRGEVFVPSLVVGCPACGSLSGLSRDVFSVTEEGITPSFICQSSMQGRLCGFHGWLRWAPEAAP